MMLRWLATLLVGALACVAVVTVSPAIAAGSSPFAERAAQLPDLLEGKVQAGRFFGPAFLSEIPPEQITLIARQLEEQNGALQGIEQILPESDFNGEVELGYKRALVRMQLVVSKDAPHLVIGLLVTSVRPRSDSTDQLSRDVRALAGTASLLVTRIDEPSEPILAVNPDQSLAVGSVFKLWVLAEAARQIGAGQRNWSDVVPLGDPSLLSGISQNWPAKAPMTLHSLATLMISLSDNSATDTLLHALDRRRVDRFVAGLFGEQAERTLPILATVEAFALKMDSATDLRTEWQRARRGDRARLLQRAKPRLSLAAIDRTQFGGGPRFIADIEWFASANDLATTFDWLRINGGAEALAIMAITVPLPQGEARRFAYVGYKGGSETGVISSAFLLHSKSGAWFVVAGSWNDPIQPVDEKRFEALIGRAVALLP